MRAAFARWGALALAAAAAAAAAQTPPLRTEVTVDAAHESLSNGSPDWREAGIAARLRWAPHALAEAGIRRVQRYGETDHELAFGVALPLDERWSATARATVVDGPNFLPRLGAGFDLSRSLPDGWVASGGWGRNLYASPGVAPSGTTSLRLGVERYVGAWRFAGDWNRARLDGGVTADGIRLQVDRYFGDDGRIGLLWARGDELENAPGGFLSTRVRTLVLTGRWPLAAGWRITGELGQARVGGAVRRQGLETAAPSGPGYHRNGVRVGVERAF